MKCGLLIAEKSSARKDIEKIYMNNRSKIPYNLDFEQFHGHVVRLKMPELMRQDWADWNKDTLPMIPTETEWKYVPESDPKRYNAVKAAIESGKYDFIINAGDYEREGQLIQDAFFSTLNIKIPIYRLWGSDLSENEVVRGLNNLLKTTDKIPGMGTVENLSKASFLRARMDWLVGLNSTRALTIRGGTTIRSGRVKLPILKILADREIAIQEFEVKPFWTVKANFKNNSGLEYEGILFDREDGKNIQFFDKNEANAINFGPDGKVNTVSKKTVKENPPKLYSIAPLQGDAAELYGIDMSDSLAAVQFLYEQKIVSYPRTDSNYITEEEVDKYFNGLNSLKYIPELKNITLPNQSQKDVFSKNKQFVDTSKVKGHSALTVLPGASIVYDHLTDVQQKILYLIGRSMILPFMGPVIKDKTEIITESSGLLFKTTGSIMTDPGWSAHVPEYNTKDNTLPNIKEGDSVIVSNSEVKEGKTTPPSRYTVKSLMSVLENIHRLIEDDEEKMAIKDAEGLGRPSTRTSILDEMVKNEYIITKGSKKEYHVTPFGVSLIRSVGHTKLASPELSAHYETLLQHIEDGSKDYKDVYNQVVKYTTEMIDELLTIPISLSEIPHKGKTVVYEGTDGYAIYESKNGYYDDKFQQWMKDGGEGEKQGLWVPKKISGNKMKLNGSISKKDIVDMMSGKEVKKSFSFKEGNKSNLVINIVDSDLKIGSGAKAEDLIIEESVIAGITVKYVSGIKNGKEFAFYKLETGQTVFEVSFGYKLNKEDLELLIKGEIIERTLVNKSGKEYKGLLTLGEDRLELSFPEKEVDYYIDKPGLRVELIEGENDKGEYSFYKVNNQFVVGTSVAGVDIDEDALSVLASGGKFKSNNWVSKKGSKFTASLFVSDGKTKFEFSNDSEYLFDEPGFKVALIEGENNRGKYSFYKVNDKFTIGTEMSGKKIGEDELRTLVSTGRLFASDWVSKKGNNFSANIVVDGDRVKFDF